MRMVFGVLALLVTLALVMVVARRQMQPLLATPPAVPASTPASMPPAGDKATAGTNLPNQVRDDLNRALQQGAERNAAAAP